MSYPGQYGGPQRYGLGYDPRPRITGPRGYFPGEFVPNYMYGGARPMFGGGRPNFNNFQVPRQSFQPEGKKGVR